MSAIQPDQDTGRWQPPPAGLNLNLASNNPFRNRAASPALSPQLTSPLERPISRNPFLDASSFPSPPGPSSPGKMAFSTDSSTKPVLNGNAAELFDALTLSDKPVPSNSGMRPAPPPPGSRPGDKAPPPPYSTGGRSENVPPRRHRPTRSQEEAMRARKAAASGSKSRPSQELNIFADPTENDTQKPESRRVRRNSESSLVDRNGKPLDPEEEKKRQERRRRERRNREREREGKDGKAKKPDRKLDIIDQLDATSIYGTGLFHHDGPFDACNPHRNRQGSRRAPMQAFPKDSLNNVLGGGGPVNKRPDHATFLGNNDQEAFLDYSKSNLPSEIDFSRPTGYRQEAHVLSATNMREAIHGDESLGLGTSTFLEGAPASRTAMQRRASEQTSLPEGLSRTKSLAQKFRGINNSSRREHGPVRVTSPDGGMLSPDPLVASPPGGSRILESSSLPNNEFTRGDDSKKESITIVEPEKAGHARAASSPPRRGLERRVTTDGTSGSDAPVVPKPSVGNSFLSRVKSLKGGPRKPKDKAIPVPLPQES